MRIQHNIMAMNAYRNYNTNVSALSKNLEKLSSGYRINRAGDDAAGLAISEKMRAQITGLDAAQKNVKDGISLVKTAEGAMQEVQDMLNRMVYLATQSANGTYDNEVDRANLQKEVDALCTEIDRIADSANFNGINLLDGSLEINESMNTAAIAGIKNTTYVEVPRTDDAASVITADMPPAGTVKDTNTILHKDGTDAQTGTFTVDLSQLKLDNDGTNIGAVTVAIGTATFTVGAADKDTDLTGKDVAAGIVAQLTAAGKAGGFVVGNANGTVEDTALKKGDLIYTATDNGDGTITFKADKYVTSDGNNISAIAADASGVFEPPAAVTAAALTSPAWAVSVNKVASNTAGATDKDGGAIVGASATVNAKDVVGTENLATTNIQTPAKAGAATLGNTDLSIDVSKLTDGMKMTIAEQTFTIATEEATAKADATAIDLSDLDLTVSADKKVAMERITQAFADNQTLSVGTDGTDSRLTLSELGDGITGKSAASVADKYKEAMGTLDGFKGLVKFEIASSTYTSELDNAESLVREGGSVVIDGKTYTFTKDAAAADANRADGDTATYLNVADGLDALKTQLETDLASKLGSVEIVDGSALKITTNEDQAEGITIQASKGNGLTLQIGDTSEAWNQLTVSVDDMHVAALGLKDLSIKDQASAADAVDKVKTAINTVSSVRGTLGATQNRLEHTANNLSVMEENITDAESTIRDTDVADEMMAYTKNNILIQSAQAMLAQANAVPQGVLQLLQ